MRHRILFVDDEVNLLQGLRRMLRSQREVWDVDFAERGEEALVKLAEQPYDVLVSDMRMPGMDGAQLLAVARERHPRTTRIILSGHAHRDMIISAVGPTQQYLSKPCDASTLIGTLNRVLAVRDLLADPALQELFGGVGSLPKPPAIYERMLALAGDPDCRMPDVVDLIESDVATSADVLRLVNSAYFGVPHRVETVERAVSLLGLETIQALAVAGAVFRSDQTLPGAVDEAALSARGIAVGAHARRLATDLGWHQERVTDAFFAGLLHEVALPALVAARPQGWPTVQQAARRLAGAADGPALVAAAQREHLGCPASRGSAYLLGLWGFAQPVVEALAWLDQPQHDPEQGSPEDGGPPNPELCDLLAGARTRAWAGHVVAIPVAVRPG
jgi:HD-like signal output (HDOD) protein/ActR/RegA family two-component response regulator